jgi:hypothetical protein
LIAAMKRAAAKTRETTDMIAVMKRVVAVFEKATFKRATAKMKRQLEMIFSYNQESSSCLGIYVIGILLH